MNSKRKMSDINPFGLRMQDELKERLDREAKINGRSLNVEIVLRLQASFEKKEVANLSLVARQPDMPNYINPPDVNDIERKLLTIFRRMPVEKQLALVSLFN